MASDGFSLDIPAPELLARIQDLFREWDLFAKHLTLTHRGQNYLAYCDAHGFTIYRLLAHCHLPPGAPGWPVCLVTMETAADETSPPLTAEDEFTSGLTLPDWLNLIKQTLGK